MIPSELGSIIYWKQYLYELKSCISHINLPLSVFDVAVKVYFQMILRFKSVEFEQSRLPQGWASSKQLKA